MNMPSLKYNCTYFLSVFRSNCVVNLSPDKTAVLREAFKVLKVIKLNFYHLTVAFVFKCKLVIFVL